RRRHTRSLRDWSSDVCSSDLADQHADPGEIAVPRGGDVGMVGKGAVVEVPLPGESGGAAEGEVGVVRHEVAVLELGALVEKGAEIGRASCRERVEMRGGGGMI